MNTFKKIGLSALDGSLAAMSVNAADLSVTGGASLAFNGQDKTNAGNTWSMNDNMTFAGSAELDMGWTVSTSFLLDNSDGNAAQIFDDRSLTIDMNDAGTLKFDGYGGVSAMHSVDDMMPYAGAAGWDMMSVATASTQTREGRITGTNSTNMMRYTLPSVVDGLSGAVSYLPSGTNAQSSTSFNFVYSGYEGLEVGYGADSNGAAAASGEVDTSTMFVKYAYGPVTVAYQQSEDDAATVAATDEWTAMGISYTVSDDISVSYVETAYDAGDKTSDEETTTISASYTMGSMSITGTHNTIDNFAGSTDAIDDVQGYKLALAFVF
jgi:outer membrane protein OmpU